MVVTNSSSRDSSPGPLEARWELKHPDREKVDILAAGLEINALMATLLSNRHVDGLEAAKRFLQPRFSHMLDPFLMKGMETAVNRILSGLNNDERICVWGDYDVDGVTSASQLVAFFRVLGRPISYFVPDRFVDGYGLSEVRIRQLAEDGVQLLITVDCGVSNVAEVAVARELGMDVVVVDHHQVPPVLPDAVAVLDPVQEDCPYPDKGLAACGVTFMLLVALRKTMRDQGYFGSRLKEPDLRHWLDLTSLGTVADMVPLRGQNRLIVKYGLAQIGRSERPGLKALCDVAGLEPKEMTAGRIGFHLGPRINAAGRVAHASAGVELLTTEDRAEAEASADAIDAYNRDRRRLQDTVFREALEKVESGSDPVEKRALVLASPGWHPGVLGIVASKIVERFHRPTVMLTIEDGVAKGSARSISGFRLVEHLRQLSDLLLSYGGHDHAAGLSLSETDLETFEAQFDAEARAVLEPHQLVPRLAIDAVHPLSQLSFQLVEELALLEPYGQGNPEPNLLATGVRVLDVRCVGKDKSHLKLTLDSPKGALDAIAFGMADRAPLPGELVDIVYVPEINEYRGSSSLQVRVKGMRPSS